MKHEEFLYQITRLLDQNKIEYCLFAGTLLGAVRDSKFLPSDTKDTDILVLDIHYWNIRNIIDKEVLKGTVEWYGINRKELSIQDIEHNYKVDIFFAEENEDKYAIYSYKPNPMNKKWNYEWRALFNANNFFPTKYIKFLGYNFKIPNNYKDILTEEYGNWKTPDKEWFSSDKTVLNVDNEYKGFYPAGISINDYKIDNNTYDIGFVCVNILRKELTKHCIESIKEHCPNIKIYVADQDEPSAEMIEFYEQNKVEYYYLPFDCGLSYSRNFLISKVKEKYLLWGDNDFIFTKNHNLDYAIRVLENFKNIGFVGGKVILHDKEQHYERNLIYDKENQLLIYIPSEYLNPEAMIYEDKYFYYTDLTFNFVLTKTNIFENDKLRWNEQLKVAYEHTDMFLKIKLFSKYKVVYCPFLEVIHNHTIDSDGYRQLRLRKTDAESFAKYWNLKSNFTIGKGKEIYHPHVVMANNELIKIQPLTSTTSKENKDIVIENIENKFINSNDFISILNYLVTQNIEFAIIKQSCLEVVKYHKLTSFPLQISIKDDKLKETLENKFKDKLYVEIDKQYRYKSLDIDIGKVPVPFPIVKYLNKTFGDNWNV